MKQDLKAFTVRLEPGLVAMIDARAAVYHRNRNSEITALLEQAIDQAVLQDQVLLKKMGDPSLGRP